MMFSLLFVKNEHKDKNNNMKNKLQKKINHRRIICLMMIIGFIMANITNLYAQTTLGQVRKNVKMTNVTIQQLVDKLGADFKYSFFIVDEKVSKTIISVDVKNATISQILDKACEGKEIIYTIKDKSITIAVKKEQPKPKSVVKKISGVVTDKNGATIIGASVRVVGVNIGTMTNINGEFTLNAPADGILHVSYIGYVSEKVAINGQTKFNIILSEDNKLLDEVMVVGYGTIKKSDLTGSVSKVKLENSTDRSSSSVQQLLQGQVSGVQITSNSGAAGAGISFAIRGANSVGGSNQPLIVIDGYPIESDDSNVRTTAGSSAVGDYISGFTPDNALANINPGEIESVEILKDASSTAIYGSRAANGVVLITTKRGKEGKDHFEYSFREDISSLPKHLDVLNTTDYINFANEAYLNTGRDSLYKHSDILKYSGTNTNWQDLIFRTGKTQNHQLSITGGDKKMKYSVILGYLAQEGIVLNDRFDRGSIRINLDRELSPKLKFGVNMSGTLTKNNSISQSSNRSDVNTSVIYGALKFRPLDTPYTSEDILDITQSGNPLVLLKLSEDLNERTTLLANINLNYTIANGLFLRFNGGVNTNYSRRDFYQPRGTYLGNLQGGFAYLGQINAFNYLTESTINFNRTINKVHTFNAVGGYAWQSWTTKTFGLTAMNFPNDLLKYYNIYSAGTISNPQTTTLEYSLASFIGRVNYNYKSKYYLTFTGRYDGSTRLSEGNKWAFFPSAALGWNMHKENFMTGLDFISQFKWRASYGISGNQTIAVGATKSKLTTTTAVVSETMQTSFSVGNMANPLLHWENTAQSDFGADITLFNNRLTFGFDLYRKLTSGLLFNMVLPPSTGFTSYSTNFGSIENKGFEFDMTGKILTKKFKWDISGNISFNRNKVVDLGGLDMMMGPSIGSVGSQTANVLKVGYPIGSFYGYRITGIYQNQQEVTDGPTDVSASPKPGSFKYKDISGINGVPDGKIDAYDREIIGNPYPDFVFGLTNNFEWKGFTLSVLVLGNIGQDVINATRWNLDGLAFNNFNVSTEAYNNRWTGEGTSNKYPKISFVTNPFDSRFSDFVVENASFVRLKNVTFAYTFNKKQIKIAQSIKLFVSGENLITITNYKGYDPEINAKGANGMTPGIDSGSTPQYRTFSAGINIGF